MKIVVVVVVMVVVFSSENTRNPEEALDNMSFPEL